jgi:hypothetical protein
MDFVNHTNFPTLLFKSASGDDMMAASLGVRVTFDVKSGDAVVSPNQDFILSNQPWVSEEFGPMENDNLFCRRGVDIMVFGKAHAPNDLLVAKMDVRVRFENKILSSLAVFGDRVWEKSTFGLGSSTPKLFKEMPLTLFNAFGGEAEWDGLKFPYSNNPHGKGFYWEKENAVNQPLPNVEDPENLISKWDQRPDPASFGACPLSELKMRDSIKFDEKGQITEINPRFYNAAFPKMIVLEAKSGQRISIEGMTKNGLFVVAVPRFSLKLKLAFGEKLNERPLYIDQIVLFPEKQQIAVTYRFHFYYKIRPMEKRVIELFENT